MKNEKTPRRIEKTALSIIVITLVVNAVLTGVNIYLTVQFKQELTNLGFLGNTSNSTSFIIAKADDANLGEPVTYFIENATIKQTTHYGTLFAVLQVVTPHYGALTISLESFNATKSEYLSLEGLNETEISYADEDESHTYIVAPGLNQISPQLRLKAQVYLNSEELPPKGETVQFSLGRLSLKAELFDMETRMKVVTEFSAEIFIVLKLPQ